MSDTISGSRSGVTATTIASGGMLCTAGGADVGEVLHATPAELATRVRWVLPDEPAADVAGWVDSPYTPTPTIIEAARDLFDRTADAQLLRSDATPVASAATLAAVEAEVTRARAGAKVACFVTGVPGGGKTLVGLQAIHAVERGRGVFLSGNGPLVAVLQEALARDHVARTGEKLEEARRVGRTFVANVHRWIEQYAGTSEVPGDLVVAFDEAQRAWSAEHAARKHNRPMSEPAQVLEILSRRPGGSLLLALIGGGQEINTGEAGLGEWVRALAQRPGWQVAASDAAGLGLGERVRRVPALDLPASRRSFRAGGLTRWVEAVLAGDAAMARRAAAKLDRFPMALGRDIEAGRAWVRRHCRGERRAGVLCSSGARRLRPLGLDPTQQPDVAAWYLNGPEDVRSSSFLELPATEFAAQGLEIHWSLLVWGGDLRRVADGWQYRRFLGTQWTTVRAAQAKVYLLNKYRVLLTRAREGMAIIVPHAADDPTRSADVYDGTFGYLADCGLPLIDDA